MPVIDDIAISPIVWLDNTAVVDTDDWECDVDVGGEVFSDVLGL